MIRWTSESSFIVRTLVNELRLAPFRGPELTRAVNFVKDGKVDFAAWRRDTSDPVFVETVEAIFRHG